MSLFGDVRARLQNCPRFVLVPLSASLAVWVSWFSTLTGLLLCFRPGWSALTQTSTSSSRWREALRSWRTRAGCTWFIAGLLCCSPPQTSMWTTSNKVGHKTTALTADLLLFTTDSSPEGYYYLWCCYFYFYEDITFYTTRGHIIIGLSVLV